MTRHAPGAYVVEQIDKVALTSGGSLDAMDLMSPYVWHDGETYRIMVRAVPRPFLPDSPTGIICSGAGSDGLNFAMDPKPAILPGPDPVDAGGCEDPTVILDGKGGYLVYYTGVDAARQQGALIVAEGPDLTRLTKRKVALQAPPGEGNIKEATLVQTGSGDWRLFYEYAANDASRIGIARGSPDPDRRWTALADPFTVRAESWDNWHLSTGPIVSIDGADPVMFYNGATHDARWRIGWVSFDKNYSRVTGRGLEPLIMPPPAEDRSATDIAFAASAIVEDGLISLYYSLEDRMLWRARVRRYT